MIWYGMVISYTAARKGKWQEIIDDFVLSL
jgi:hypothetical protein